MSLRCIILHNYVNLLVMLELLCAMLPGKGYSYRHVWPVESILYNVVGFCLSSCLHFDIISLYAKIMHKYTYK